jgi:hypothetical protein
MFSHLHRIRSILGMIVCSRMYWTIKVLTREPLPCCVLWVTAGRNWT